MSSRGKAKQSQQEGIKASGENTGREKTSDGKNKKPVQYEAVRRVFSNDEHRKLYAYGEKKRNVFIYVVAIFFILVFTMLCVPNVMIDIDLGTAGAMLGDVKTSMNINGFNVFNAFKNPKKDTFDYIVNNIEALEKAISMGQSKLIYDAITDGQRALLDMAFLAIGILSLLVIVAAFSMVVLSAIKVMGKKISDKVVYMSLFLTSILVLAQFIIMAIMQGEGTAEIKINMGIGIWFNFFLCLGFCSFSVIDLIKSGRLEAYEKNKKNKKQSTLAVK